MKFSVPPSQVHAARLSLPRPPPRGRQPSKPPRCVYPESVSVIDTTTASSASSSFDASRRRNTPQPPQLISYQPPFPQQHSRAPSAASHARQRSIDSYGRSMYPSQVMTPMSMTPQSQRASSVQRQRCRFMGDITVECIDCSPYIGRCGLIIFFLLAYGVKHRLSVLPMDTDLKSRVESLRKKRGGLPKPAWPICFHGHFFMTEPYATLRYLAKHLGLYGQNPERDYTADWLLESFAYWRDSLSVLIREPVSPERFQSKLDQVAIDTYLEETRPGFLGDVERILELNETEFFLGDEISWVDPPLFSILYEDNVYVYLTVKERVLEYARALEYQKENASLHDARSEEDAQAEEDGLPPPPPAQLMSLKDFEDEMNKHVTLVEDHYPRVARLMDSVSRQAGLLHGWLIEHRQIWNLCQDPPDIMENNICSRSRPVGNRPRSNAEHWITPTEFSRQLPGAQSHLLAQAGMYGPGDEMVWAEAQSPATHSQRSAAV